MSKRIAEPKATLPNAMVSEEMEISCGIMWEFSQPQWDTIRARVRAYSTTAPQSEPDALQDFGAFEFAGQTICWKAEDWEHDSARPTLARRLILVALAREL